MEFNEGERVGWLPFRRRLTDDDSARRPARSSTLGRVPLVRMRVKTERADVEDEKVARMLRLLASF